MARPRTNLALDQFTAPEAAVIGAKLPNRAGAILEKGGLSPEPFAGIKGRAGVIFYNARGLAHWALIGGLFGGGVPLLASARLGAVVADELAAAYGRLPSNLAQYLQRPLNPTPGTYPWPKTPDNNLLSNDISYDFWLHHFLRIRTDIYKPGVTLRGDFFIEIADREFVFTDFDSKGKLKVLSPFRGESREVLAEYRIVGWKRGSNDVEVRYIFEEVPRTWVDSDPDALAKGRSVESHFHAARDNAVSVLRVNVSLAIRNALDAIHSHRIMKGMKFDGTVAAVPETKRHARI
jgi:hypothetical protein